ncbi:MAG: PBP1A family penicillin-binding protein [Nitrospiraceae bacterium]|nr:PBP1A family penicillin-binding protein [Nitrospiraceae bacterium]
MRLKAIIFISIVLIGILTGGYIAIATGVPSVSELKQYRTLPGTKVYADDDTLIGEFKIEKGVYVPLNQMPNNLKNAVIAVEDSRFMKHKGIDYIGIGRALVTDILHASIKEGGSTITQQLAKVLFLSPEKTIKRKLREVQLAVKLENELTKNEILELYLNKVYFGHGAHGVEMASRVYFGKSVRDLNLAEAALIAGLVKAPNTYSPYNNLVRAKERQETVLMRMKDEGYITAAQQTAAARHQITLSSLRSQTDSYGYFLEYVRQQVELKYGTELVYKGGLKIYTTLDRRAQAQAQRALQDGLRDVDKRRGWRGPAGKKEKTPDDKEPKVAFSASTGDISTGVVQSVKQKEATVVARGIKAKLNIKDAMWASNILDKKTGRATVKKNFRLTDILNPGDIIWVKFLTAGKEAIVSLEQEPEVEGSLVSLDPETGYVRAVTGGFSFTKSEYNRALLAKRQPGSSFKPVIFAAALEHGFSPASVINDEPVSYRGANGESWKPENYDKKFMGPTRLREALAYSRNIVTVKLIEALGIDKVLNLAKEIGIETDLPRDFTIALGSTGVTPLELTAAYSAFANGGMKVKPVWIKYITDSRDSVLEDNEPETVAAMSPQASFLLTSMLQDVIKYGTGTRANIGRPAAGKTGTSNDFKDAWFIGYTPELITCVWVGYDDMRRTLGHGETGGRAAAPIWARYMSSVLSDTPATDFTVPEGIEQVVIGRVGGLFSAPVYEYFKEGTVPELIAPAKSLRGVVEADHD